MFVMVQCWMNLQNSGAVEGEQILVVTNCNKTFWILFEMMMFVFDPLTVCKDYFMCEQRCSEMEILFRNAVMWRFCSVIQWCEDFVQKCFDVKILLSNTVMKRFCSVIQWWGDFVQKCFDVKILFSNTVMRRFCSEMLWCEDFVQ